MKQLVLILAIAASSLASAQQLNKAQLDSVSADACDCIDDISSYLDMRQRNDEIKSCIGSAITKEQISRMNNAADGTEIVVDPTVNFAQVETNIIAGCTSFKKLRDQVRKEQALLVSDNKEVNRMILDGNKLLESKDYESATIMFERMTAADPQFSFGWQLLGDAYGKSKKYTEAIRAYDRALALNPSNKAAAMNKARTQQESQDFQGALRTYQNLGKADPNDPDPYFGIGVIMHQFDMLEQGLDYSMTAYKLYEKINSPAAVQAKELLAVYYRTLKEKGRSTLFSQKAQQYGIPIFE